MRERPDRDGLPRRRVLRALALAPAALAGCAAGRPETVPPGAPAAAGGAPPAPPARTASPGATAAVRAFRLPPEAEPAFVFRAAGARPGEPT